MTNTYGPILCIAMLGLSSASFAISDQEFEIVRNAANQALSAAVTIRDFVVERLPEGMR